MTSELKMENGVYNVLDVSPVRLNPKLILFLKMERLLTHRKMSFTAGVFKRIETIRGFYAVRPLSLWG